MAIKSTKRKSKKRKIAKELPESQAREITAILMYTFATVFLFSLSGSAGIIGDYINTFLISLFGIGAFMFPFILIVFASYLFFIKDLKFHFHRLTGTILLFISILSLFHIGAPLEDSYSDLKDYGGIIGFVFSTMFRIGFGDILTSIIFIAVFIIALQLIIGISFKDLYFKTFHPISDVDIKRPEKYASSDIEDAQVESIDQDRLEFTNAKLDIIKPRANAFQNKTITDGSEKIAESPPANTPAIVDSDEATGHVGISIKKKKDYGIKISNFSSDDDWEFPSLDLLSSEISNVYPDDNLLKDQADNIKEKLAQFGIKVEMVSARVGPTVTQFTLKPDEGIKVSKIIGFKDDLALSLSAKSVRIEAPIPGQPYIGIEIPNEERSTVYMKEVLTSDSFTNFQKSKLKLCMGKDVSGQPIITDLDKMPHLLMAGSTGSGKSVGMNTFLISLLYQNSPKELKFIMIDPKMVELEAYNGIPHLLTPVIMDADRALSALKWAVSEMMRRYTECREKGYRNISEFNEVEERKMPKIVIVIDELADLMMREFKKETEAAICRIAQMARAVGIHLIIATQRPSVDVITGLIKANIPTRISFSVTSSIDSRTIIDSVGAEDLLGMGDMLYISPSLSKPLRVQGIFISSKEIEKVTTHIKLAKEPEYDEEDLEMQEKGSAHQGVSSIDLDAVNDATEEDDKIPEAIEVIRRTGKASATLLQRMLSVGYARAAKILDILERKGLIGPANGAKARQIHMDRIED